MGEYKSGYCSVGLHEGLQPRNINAKALPTCQMWQTCTCDCHRQLTEMFKMGEQERVPVNFSDYVPDKGDYVMPSLTELALARASSNGPGDDAPILQKSELPDAIPATLTRSFAATPSGRAARHELEYQVKQACDVWVVEYGQVPPIAQTHPCTPKYLSAEIGKTYGIKPPSVGAIDAVFVRWVKIGFADIGKRPTRFLGYTKDGIELTLDGCKERAKQQKVKT